MTWTSALRNTSDAAPPSDVAPQPNTEAGVSGWYSPSSRAEANGSDSYGRFWSSVRTATSEPRLAFWNCGCTQMSVTAATTPSLLRLSSRPATTCSDSGVSECTQCAAVTTLFSFAKVPPQYWFPWVSTRYTTHGCSAMETGCPPTIGCLDENPVCSAFAVGARKAADSTAASAPVASMLMRCRASAISLLSAPGARLNGRPCPALLRSDTVSMTERITAPLQIQPLPPGEPE